MPSKLCHLRLDMLHTELQQQRKHIYSFHLVSAVAAVSPVSIQTQSLALRALRKRKPQETQSLALTSSQSWLPLLQPSIPIGWRLRLLRHACISCGFRLCNARNFACV